MGQYRLWLQYREIDQLLHAQLKTLVKELTQVDEQIDLLASTTLPVDNVIIQALLKELQVEVSLVPVPDVPAQAIFPPIQSSPTSELSLADAVDRQGQQLPDPVSSALFMWGNLPNFVSLDMQDSTRQTDVLEPVPPTPLSAENLLPADIQTFVETYGPAAPQAKSSWRLPGLLRPSHSTPADSPASPVDQQSIRVNQVVKRWFERRTHFGHGASRNLEEQKESMA
jgi:hypothetical protein